MTLFLTLKSDFPWKSNFLRKFCRISSGKGKASYGRAGRLLYTALPFFLMLLTFLNVQKTAAQTLSTLPIIPRLDSRDTMFRQYQQDVEAARRALYSSRGNLEERAKELAALVTIFSYVPGEGEELIGIAARCNIPYGTLASLNRFSHGEDMMPGRVLLLPSVPGLFIPEKPATDLEMLLASVRQDSGILLSVPKEGRKEQFRFFPGDDLSATERVFFLNRGFSFPLRNFEISSFYGQRINPVTGRLSMHRGLDLAAPMGAEVYSVKSGTVLDLGEDPVLGKYVIVGHENNWVSFYGHLSSITTALHMELQSASLIGKVGTTGQSTGPHLHFEIRQNGQSQDPARLLRFFKGNTGQ